MINLKNQEGASAIEFAIILRRHRGMQQQKTLKLKLQSITTLQVN
jgi:hypothetical protein